METNSTVLIVDDEPNAVKVLSAILKSEGYNVLESMDVDNAIGVFNRAHVDAIITDIRMPDKDGYHLFDYVTEHHPHVPVMFLTAYGTVESAVQAVTSGAYYYFIKPPDYGKLKSVLSQAIQRSASLQKCLLGEREGTPGALTPCRLTGKSQAMLDIFKTIALVKDTESSVLIQGETGTGKEVIAANLHYRSSRQDKPFVAVNCAAIPRELIEAELFGHEKGAFTGAAGSRTGKIEEAADGTLFLDEIGELELSLQAKLLRMLQERAIERLGSNKKIKLRFRLISSTNRDLKKEMEAGRFRSDLFYRINVVPIDVPPLRERREDIAELAEEFMREFCTREKKQLSLSDEALSVFMKHPWPGNIRQLRNVIEHAVVVSPGRKIRIQDLPADILEAIAEPRSPSPFKTLRDLEQQAITTALRECNGNKSHAARKLGISRKALYARLRNRQ
jgi:DNA-binding NtrC family response regulator